MNKPHAHAECIKAWADGVAIQILNYNGLWLDLPPPADAGSCPHFWPAKKYRVKPETVKYRLALRDAGVDGKKIVLPYAPEQYQSVERSPHFIRWLGEEQEVEV